ncbi:triose-phosphate isomerase [Candidatus Woesearchaeota archaeon]|nr:triose-phosphate isomerase [Candidatus Woesearchaeota archaeon]
MKYIINFKTYKEGTGKNALKLIKQLESTKMDPILCLQPGDVHLSSKTKLTIWAQHVDPINYGSNTGWILPEDMKANGVKGVLINHSEHKTTKIREILKECKELKLKTMVLVPKPEDVKKFVKYNPDYIGVEPPEYIGSKTTSVTSKPNLIEKSVKNSAKIPLFVGAGIKSKEDIIISKKLGAKGVLIASAIVTSKTPSKKLLELKI